MYNKRSIGAIHEQYAMQHLSEQGYDIIETNFYCRSGEIDIIARHKGYLVFIEVKYRTSNRLGEPEEAVNYRKQQRIIRSARFYLLRHGLGENIPCRFDVVVILGKDIRIIEDAFTV